MGRTEDRRTGWTKTPRSRAYPVRKFLSPRVASVRMCPRRGGGSPGSEGFAICPTPQTHASGTESAFTRQIKANGLQPLLLLAQVLMRACYSPERVRFYVPRQHFASIISARQRSPPHTATHRACKTDRKWGMLFGRILVGGWCARGMHPIY